MYYGNKKVIFFVVLYYSDENEIMPHYFDQCEIFCITVTSILWENFLPFFEFEFHISMLS